MNRRIKKKERNRQVDRRLDELEYKMKELNTVVTGVIADQTAHREAVAELTDDFDAYRSAQRQLQRAERNRRLKRELDERRKQERKRDLRRRGSAFLLALVVGMALIALLMPDESKENPPVIGAVQTAVKPAEAVVEATKTVIQPTGRYDAITAQEREMLARLLWLEARGESAEGQQAAAEVVLNRVAADNFPNTVAEVIFDADQFSTAGQLDEATPTTAQYDAIDRAMEGKNILPPDVVYFSGKGENDRVWGRIGGHVFCYQYQWEVAA